jgi:ribonucleoside-diphosphate reductase alpha chain
VEDVGAIDQLELWKIYKEHWAEHSVSMTCYVKEHQWMEVGAWVYKHFDTLSGVAFLPAADHCYAQAPYQEIDQKAYEALVAKMPKSIDWNRLADYEKDDDAITGYRETSCSGGVCEIVDVGVK